MTFVELVTSISESTGMTKKDVSQVLKALPVEVRKALKGGERVKFPSFGSFYVAQLTNRKVIRFKESRTAMEKLGVEVDDEKTKTSSKTKGCPVCGRELVADSSVPKCPEHGTKPFEKTHKE